MKIYTLEDDQGYEGMFTEVVSEDRQKVMCALVEKVKRTRYGAEYWGIGVWENGERTNEWWDIRKKRGWYYCYHHNDGQECPIWKVKCDVEKRLGEGLVVVGTTTMTTELILGYAE